MKLSIVSIASITVSLLDDPSGFGDPTQVWCTVTRELVYAKRELWNFYRVGIYLYVSLLSHALTLKFGVPFPSKRVQGTWEVCTTRPINVFCLQKSTGTGVDTAPGRMCNIRSVLGDSYTSKHLMTNKAD
jgi:hypothetical protein